MNNKKMIIHVSREHGADLCSVLSNDLLQEIYKLTGLQEQDLFESLQRLENMGIISTEVVTMH